MPVYTIQTPDGRKLKIEAADEAAAMRGAQEWSSGKGKAPGYAKARSKIDRNDAITGRKQDFTDQLVANLGVNDELSGAVNFLAQGGENAIRRATGKPVDVKASEAYSAAADDAKVKQADYARDKPVRNVLATIGGIAVSGKPTGAPVGPLSALRAGRNAAVVNAPFAVARQDGSLPERLPGAALETALTFGAGSVLQAGANRLGAMAASRAASGASAAVKPQTEMARRVAAFDQANVDPTLASVKGGAASNVANAISENPLGFRQRAQLGRSVEQTGEAANVLSQQYGAQRGAQIVGEDVQKGVNTFAKQTFGDKAAALYDKAFTPILAAEQRAASVPGLPTVQATETAKTLQEIGGQVNSAALSGIITDPRVKTIATALSDDPASVRFGDLRALRTWVREAKANPTLRQGMSQASLSRVEGALTDDIYANAGRLGGNQSLKALQDADKFYRAGSQRIETALQPFANAKSGESAYTRIIQSAGSTGSADSQKLLSLKRSLPASDWGDVAATTLKEMGRPSTGAANAAQADAFSVNTFLTNYAKLSDRGRNILFGDVGGGGARATALKKELDNLIEVAGLVKAVEKGANASRSGVSAQSIGTATAALGSAVTGTWPAFLSAAAGTAALGEAMTNPAFVRWLARAPKPTAPPGAVEAHLAKLASLAANDPALGQVYERVAARLAGNDNPSGPLAAQRAATPR